VGGFRVNVVPASPIIIVGQLPAPTGVTYINQGGPNNSDASHPNSLSNYTAIQWNPVTNAATYNIYRSVNGGPFTLYQTGVTPQTFIASIAPAAGGVGGVMTVTQDFTSGNIIPGCLYSTNPAGITAETTISDKYGGANQNGTTTGTGGTGTYPVNIAQTLSSRTFSACVFIDKVAPNAANDLFTGPNNVYDYNVAAVDSSNNVGVQSSSMVMWGYHNGYTRWHGLMSLPVGEEESFGTPNSIYNSTNGNPQGGPFVLEYTVNQGLQLAVSTPQVPEWTAEVGWARYLIFDFNPGAYTGWPLDGGGSVSRVPPGDRFGLAPQFDLLQYAQGPVAANTWVTCKVPLGAYGMTRNTFTGSISNGSGGSGSTCAVTAVGAGLFGAAGAFDKPGFITGAGIPSGCWVDSNITTGSGPGGSGPGSTWQILNGTGNGTPININATSDGSWTYYRTALYKFTIYTRSGPAQQSYLNNVGFSRT
jgi:hypothetical protein